ncbi:MAG: DNA primase [Candidatus Omnitrophica bacterium]|nr:DNA primase [Candidatus Omnitrophota bacterium]
MGLIPQNTIDQILDRLDIVEVISGYISLKKNGRNYKSNCPFHNEKTPSFVVSEDKQIYHCFGCSASGNAIGFVMQYEKMTFPEAVRALGEKTGIEIPGSNFEGNSGDSPVLKLYEVNQIAAQFYHNELSRPENRNVLEYLHSRGIQNATIREFMIGFAPDSWDSLIKHSHAKKVDGELLRKAGLTVESTKGKNDYDRFRNRITFPVLNERGNVIAFGARVLDKSLPKYLNTPETPIYTKGKTLYGLNLSKDHIREKKYVIIVEGYLDVIIPFQNGIKNVVAASGTALTEKQVKTIKKYADTAVIVFDSDQAGIMASLRGLDIVTAEDVVLKVATLPQGDDPDTFVRAKGPEAFREILEKAPDVFDYKFDFLRRQNPGSSLTDKVRIVKEMLPTLARINNEVIRSEYLKKLSERLSIDQSSLKQELDKLKPDIAYKETEVQVIRPRTIVTDTRELFLLGFAISAKRFHLAIEKEVGIGDFTNADVKKLLESLSEIYVKEESVGPAKFLARIENDDALIQLAVKALEKVDVIPDKEKDKALSECIRSMKKGAQAEELKELNARLREAQSRSDHGAVSTILVRLDTIHRERVSNT